MKIIKFLGKILAILYTLIFIIVLSTLLALYSSKKIISPSTYKQVISSIDLNTIDLSVINIEDEESQTIEEYLIKQLQKLNITEEKAKEVLNNQELRNELTNLLVQTTDYFLQNSNQKPQINKQNIESIVYKLQINENLKENNIDLDELIDMINNYVEEQLPNDIEYEEYNEILNYTKELLNSNILQVSIIIFILISLLIFMLLTWSVIKPLLYIGVSFIIIGIFNLFIRISLPIAISKLSNLTFISPIINILLVPTLYIGIILFIVGIILIILKSKLTKFKRDSNE